MSAHTAQQSDGIATALKSTSVTVQQLMSPSPQQVMRLVPQQQMPQLASHQQMPQLATTSVQRAKLDTATTQFVQLASTSDSLGRLAHNTAVLLKKAMPKPVTLPRVHKPAPTAPKSTSMAAPNLLL